MTLVLNGTTGVSSVDGSASTPAVQGTDTNTGMFFPAADTVAIATGGTERVRTDSSGNVGIGTSSPNLSASNRALTVNAPNAGDYSAVELSSGGALRAYMNATNGAFYIVSQSTNPMVFYTNGSERARIDSSGNVGIGTSSPGARLQVTDGNFSQLYLNSTTTVSGVRFGNTGSTNGYIYYDNGANLTFQTNGAERARIDSSGRFMIGTTSATGYLTVANNPGDGALVVHFTRPGVADSVLFYASNAYSPNGAAATIRMGSISSTGRSINAGGTINASGADYAEYMTKAGDFTIAKGDVCGIDANGKLTNVFADSVAFVVKSTDPSYVGGDRWGTADALGVKEPAALTGEATEEEKAQYEVDKAAFDAALEVARQKVDRIAFSGQVPVNVMGATPGQYIVPVDDNGSIKGVAKNEADLTLAEYMKAVGKVIAVEADGRAKIIVKVA